MLVAQISKPQQMIWNLILSSQGLSVYNYHKSSHLKFFLQKKARENQLPDLCIVDVMYFIRQEESPYEFCRWCDLNYPEVEVILTHETAPKVSQAERLWAIKQGAQDLLPGFPALHLRAEIILGLQRVLEVLDLLPIDQIELGYVFTKIQKIMFNYHQLDRLNMG
ncbi:MULTISPECIES: response regulator [Limnospira]|uniref:response regulator n=1 Tax=Limnospira TaxID=2596745 RepID=UPI00235501CE|nr:MULTISPECIES: response regulator [Limnospira]MDT9274273.1 response regulator [Limnospira sp. PMC 737.11]